ncbi:hypothetical protein QFZ96_004413 [Paraburkholderia youngii]
MIYYGGMNLRTYFQTTKPAEREAFAAAVEASVDYLYLCSRRTRNPGNALCKRIVAYDPRFTLAELRPDIWGNGVDSIAASDDVQRPIGGTNKSSKSARMVI